MSSEDSLEYNLPIRKLLDNDVEDTIIPESLDNMDVEDTMQSLGEKIKVMQEQIEVLQNQIVFMKNRIQSMEQRQSHNENRNNCWLCTFGKCS